MWMGFFRLINLYIMFFSGLANLYVMFVRDGKSVCDVLSELANLYVMFCQSWQICM